MPPGVPRDQRARGGSDFPDPEFIAEAEKMRMALNPIPKTTLRNMIVEGLSMPAALKEKLKPILAPKG